MTIIKNTKENNEIKLISKEGNNKTIELSVIQKNDINNLIEAFKDDNFELFYNILGGSKNVGIIYNFNSDEDINVFIKKLFDIKKNNYIFTINIINLEEKINKLKEEIKNEK